VIFLKNKYLFLIILILFSLNLYANENPKDKFVKRKVAIISLFNSSKDPRYDYLVTTISDALRGELSKTGFYEIMDPVTIAKRSKDNKININKFIWENDAINIGESLKSDVVIFGFFSVEQDKITVYMNALDVAVRKSAINLERSGGLGIGAITLANNISSDMASTMKEKLPPFKSKVKLAPMNIAGIVLAPTGATIAVAGTALLVYDLIGYSQEVKLKETNKDAGGTFEQYKTAYDTYIGLFYSGVTMIAIGGTLAIVSIPLIAINPIKLKNKIRKNKEISFNMSFHRNMNIWMSFKF